MIAYPSEMPEDSSAWRALYAEDATVKFVYGASAHVGVRCADRDRKA